MNKYIIGLLLLTTTSSCIEKNNSDYTKMGFYSQICYDISSNATSYSELLYTAKRADEWQTADSDKKKYEIEDKYFDDYKIREIEDTIAVKRMCNFITYGKKLNEENSIWKVITDNETILIERKSDNVWTMKGNNRNHVTEFELSYSLNNINETKNLYTIKGNCKYKTSNDIDIKYEISRDLIMNHGDMPCRYYSEGGAIGIGRIIEDGEINCKFINYDKIIPIKYTTRDKILFKYDEEWIDIPFYSYR